ncbi:hypothetical protein ERO13_A09G029732v2 [Gossypium hirsutum]|uniref:Uncharacterized protein n=1 Tax=Gossypium darwinii TaxID=34276 RepID=A0A5D2F7H1_GOSDA|nr:hypothetical protein ERO13_A09G029732v2 [Gossypium hirsutum]TYH01193.1 hypothetical protein ES288_A09G037900v1 [Gossypium darwinii]
MTFRLFGTMDKLKQAIYYTRRSHFDVQDFYNEAITSLLAVEDGKINIAAIISWVSSGFRHRKRSNNAAGMTPASSTAGDNREASMASSTCD